MRISTFVASIAASVLTLAVGAGPALAAGAPPATSTSGSPGVVRPMVTKLSHADATSRLRAAGITWSSSGGCSNRNNPTCTSFEQVNLDTIRGIITLKNASGCAVNVTGGTETGHAGGTYSHWNGYKLDISIYTCVSNYITRTFTFIGYRSDGAAMYRSAAGNIYAREGNHWDITYYNCGGC
ncbi:hypothetical protein [Actinopolymorpha alba]|uniref:hypothetical protein n=1 Tax=Actinopolymorpha alba TaxID=533267 RepID=UPI000367BCCB|nr:hypothetical protein [Actinopolymorpha alba]